MPRDVHHNHRNFHDLVTYIGATGGTFLAPVAAIFQTEVTFGPSNMSWGAVPLATRTVPAGGGGLYVLAVELDYTLVASGGQWNCLVHINGGPMPAGMGKEADEKLHTSPAFRAFSAPALLVPGDVLEVLFGADGNPSVEIDFYPMRVHPNALP